MSFPKLVVLDMAGTTVRDEHEVEACFAEAAAATGLHATPARILAAQGQAKRAVFEALWQEQLQQEGLGPLPAAELAARVEHSYQVFREVLEAHYRRANVQPTAGCLDLFVFLKSQGVRIALTTGFYRTVTDLILQRLGWDLGLDARRRGNRDAIIDLSIASDEVPAGRPAPLMIQRAMQELAVTDPRQVWNVGDTPSDLESGRRAGVRSLGVVNGTHTRAQLAACPNDGLLASLTELHQQLQGVLVA